MMSYLDMAFCAVSLNKCTNTHCFRYPSAEDEDSADRLGLPMAYVDISPTCDRYTPRKEDN